MEKTEIESITIGQQIGVVGHSFGITNAQGEKTTVSVKIDFSTCSDNDLKNWLVSNRIIAGQRPWRSLSLDELKALNGTTFNANSIGQKVRSRDEQKNDLITTFVNAGVKLEQATALAEAALNNPESLTITK